MSAIVAHVSCRGHESSLAECSYSTRSNDFRRCLASYPYYSRRNPVGVQCKSGTFMIIPPPTIYPHLNFFVIVLDIIQNGHLRLTNGLTQYEGRVEMFLNSRWRAICSDGWDESDARVVCKQLHYLATSVRVEGIAILL